jgi:hypothetical protein
MWWSQVRADHFVASRRLTIAFEPRSVCGHRVAGPFMTFTSSAMSPSGGSLLPQISDNWAHCQGTSVSRSVSVNQSGYRKNTAGRCRLGPSMGWCLPFGQCTASSRVYSESPSARTFADGPGQHAGSLLRVSRASGLSLACLILNEAGSWLYICFVPCPRFVAT